MQQRLSVITLGVADLARSRAFYDGLGFRAATEVQAEAIVAYNVPAHAPVMALVLYPLEKLAEDVGEPMRAARIGQRAPLTLAHNVASEAEADALLARFAELGGEVVKPAAKAFWGGYSGYAADPDGHIWEVAVNPFDPLGPNGEFVWAGQEDGGNAGGETA